jgi:hypothetical protein
LLSPQLSPHAGALNQYADQRVRNAYNAMLSDEVSDVAQSQARRGHTVREEATVAADLGTSFTPGVSDARDAYEVATGKDFITDEKLSGWQYWATVGGLALPVVGGAFFRKSARVINATEEAREASRALNATEEAAQAATSSVPGAAELRPYGGPGGGHHVPAKSAFTGAPGYNANAALAIPNAELARLGVDHAVVSGSQQIGYRRLAQSGGAVTWQSVETIETKALIQGGMQASTARTTVQKAIQSLKDAGVPGPTRIPWGGK